MMFPCQTDWIKTEGCEWHEKRRFVARKTPMGRIAINVFILYDTGKSAKFKDGLVEVFKTRYFNSINGANNFLSRFDLSLPESTMENEIE